MNPSLVGRFCACAALLCGFAALFASDDVPGFSGYTRPGWPNDIKAGEIRLIADDAETRDKAIGGTVFFTVLQLSNKVGDSWASGLPHFNNSFMPGILSDGTSSPALDTNARYLYLYQVVNDRRTPTPIGNASVKLIVEPPDVTSWGHFDGVGFAVPLRTEKQAAGGEQIRPVSYTNVLFGGIQDRIYKSPAEYVLPGRPLVLTRVPTKLGEEAPREKDDQRVVRVAWDALDPALNPNHVMLLHISDFNQMPCIRAVWSTDNGIKKDMRSTVFGFTSNWPPTYEPVRLRGLQSGKAGPGDMIKPVADKGPFKEEPGQMDESDGRLGAVGNVPTPKPERPVVAGDGGGSRGDKGMSPALTNYSGAGQTAPAAGAASAGAYGNPGVGNGGGNGASGTPVIPGSSSGSGTRTVVESQNGSTSAQQGNQSQSLIFNSSIINEESQNQLQSQFQQQQQQQNQSNTNNNNNHEHKGGGGGVPNEVVPSPAGFVLAALGLPVLIVLLIRRRATPGAV